MIEIAPETFLGDVPCTEQVGGLTRYVATLTDVTARLEAAGGANGAGGSDDGAAGEADFALPSSAPVPCLSGVGFGFVVPGRKYEALVEGYDTDQLVPRAPGSRLMVEVDPSWEQASGTPEQIAAAPLLAPRWTTTCAATTAVARTVLQASCQQFVASGDGVSELRVSVRQLLGELVCGDEPGQVERLSVSLDVGEDAPREVELACDAEAEAIFSDLPARTSASAYVSAFSAGSEQPLAGAKCEALTLPSASVTASCVRLNQLGTLRVALPEALAALDLTCSPAALSDVLIDVPGETSTRHLPPPDCLQPFDHGFAAGTAAVSVTVLNGDAELASLTCGAEILPGSLVVADCVQNQAP
jgi:hypothetical protein